MSILEELKKDTVWAEFLQYKIERRHMPEREIKYWTEFVEKRAYEEITEHITEADFCFDYPTKMLVNKSGTGKKRVVYSYGEKETAVLKILAYLLYRYDDKICDNCFSFRRNSTAKEAVVQILKMRRLDGKYTLKVDISNYFNSIPPERLVEVLRDMMADDPVLLHFLERLLTEDKAYEDGIVAEEKRGAMAGIPIAPFFANVYLKSMDEEFKNRGVAYYRYSDDILLFADSEEELKECETMLYALIAGKGLAINPEKVKITGPGEGWEFLGFAYRDGKVDLSEVTKNKLKAKIKRKAHKLYRWRVKKDLPFEPAAKAMIRVFNRKFYDDTDENKFTWSRWFFPVLTTDKGLKEIDAYLIQYIRYLYSGRHYKGNYRITYDEIKELGYRSLVNEYYKKTQESAGIYTIRNKSYLPIDSLTKEC